MRLQCTQPARGVPTSSFFGQCWADQGQVQVQALIGRSLAELFLVGTVKAAAFTVPCYDTSLYLDDLALSHSPIPDHAEATTLIADEARQGYARGHRWVHLCGMGRGNNARVAGTAGYTVIEGKVTVPASSGFGLTLDEELFQTAVASNGYRVA